MNAPLDAALVVDKPAGLTSHDVVARARRLLGERSIGHLGTLDPAATGVLPLLTGRMTRLARFFQNREKEYEGEVIFGFATSTYDAGGDPLGDPSAATARRLDRSDLLAALAPFRGRILQTPPPFSAKKVAGRRAYALARRGEVVTLAPVEVEIFELTLLDWRPAEDRAPARARLRVRCSSGAYVRSLAHDLGQALGVGAHLGRLRRARVGEFGLDRALDLTALAETAARFPRPADWERAESEPAAAWRRLLLSPRELLPEFPAVVAPPDAAARLLQGRGANLPEFSGAANARVFAPDGAFLAIARRLAGSLFRPEIVFPRAPAGGAQPAR